MTDNDVSTNVSAERITVSLTSRSARALQLAVDLTGDNKTDTVNRALQVYAYLEKISADSGAIYVRETSESGLHQLKFF